MSGVKKGEAVGKKFGLERYGFLHDNDHLRLCIKAYLKANDKSLRSISRDLKLSPGDVSNYLSKSKRGLSDYNVIRLSKACKIKISLKIEYEG